MKPPRTLIAGFGNVLLGDDGFGVEVVRRLAGRRLPVHVETLDVGIGGMDFVLEAMSGFERVIVVDAVRRGKPPGTLHVFAPSPDEIQLREDDPVNPHITEPVRAMRLARGLGVLPADVTVIGCEPELSDLETRLSAPVEAAVGEAVARILTIVGEGDHAGRAVR